MMDFVLNNAEISLMQVSGGLHTSSLLLDSSSDDDQEQEGHTSAVAIDTFVASAAIATSGVSRQAVPPHKLHPPFTHYIHRTRHTPSQPSQRDFQG